MRALVVLLLFVAAGAAWFLFRSDSIDSPAPGPGPGPAQPALHAVQSPGLPAGIEATRTKVESHAAEDVASAPTACIRVLDYTTKKPVLGAAVRRVLNGGELAFTDDRGIANLPLPNPEQLAVVFDGYLLRLVPAQIGTDEKEPQEVQLVRDEWSPRRKFHFVGPGAASLKEAFVRFHVTAAQNAAPPVPRDDAVLRRAWTEHVMLASRPVCSDVAVQLGSYDENRVHRLADGGEVRFVGDGVFTVEAATADGYCARTELRIAGKQAEPVRLDFVVGAFVDGVVTSLEGGAAAAGAKVSLEGGDPLGLIATTDGDGRFRFGPVVPGPVTLHVLCAGKSPLAFGPTTAPASGLHVELTTLRQTMLRGHVRARPDGAPVARAAVIWKGKGGATQVVSGTDGAFELPVQGTEAATLMIQATGFQTRSELVEPGAADLDYQLWPSDPQQRVAEGLTCVLRGFVHDSAGKPIANMNVRWKPVERTAPPTLDGRRVLEGATLALPLTATSDGAGAFQLETDQFGPGQLFCGDSKNGFSTKAIAGRQVDGLRLQP